MRMCNKYCSNCLKTQRFHDLGSHLVCERCTKRLERIVADQRKDASAAPLPADIPWVERADDVRRDAM